MAILETALAASGGVDRWRGLTRFTAHIAMGGALLTHHSWKASPTELVAEGCTHIQSIRFTGFPAAECCSGYRREHAYVETLAGEPLAARDGPREALAGQADATTWDDLHLLCFCGISLWQCLTLPFHLAQPGTSIRELEPWQERGETWHRLRAVVPMEIATHSSAQILYFDQTGLLRRVDYHPIGMGGGEVAHYCQAHQDFSAIVVPTLHRMLSIDSEGAVMPKPTWLDIEIFDIRFE